MQYQLASPYTNWLVIAERSAEEKSGEMPALRKVPQTMAAGWGGTGSVHADMAPMAMYAMAPAPAPAMVERTRRVSSKLRQAFEAIADLEVPTFIRNRRGDDAPPSSPPPSTPAGRSGEMPNASLLAMSQQLEGLLNADPSRLEEAHITTLVHELVFGAAGGRTFERFVQLAASDGVSERDAATVLLAELLRVLVLTNLGAAAQRALDAFQRRAQSRSLDRARSAAVLAEAERVCRACVGRGTTP